MIGFGKLQAGIRGQTLTESPYNIIICAAARRRQAMSKISAAKDERLRQLWQAGFNIADFVCFAPGELDPVRLERFFRKYEKRHGISLRHFHENESRFFKCPVKYEVTDWKTALRFCQEHNRTFYTLCNEAIPLDDAIYGGNIWLLDDRDYVVEYFDGPGSPRDTETKELKFIKRTIGEQLPADAPEELRQLAARFRRFIPETRPIVIEFNIYPYPVGRLKEKSIIWEWRQGLIHESLDVLEFLLEENQQLRTRIATLESLVLKMTR